MSVDPHKEVGDRDANEDWGHILRGLARLSEEWVLHPRPLGITRFS